MKRISADFIYTLILTLIALFGVKALMHPGFYTSHDGTHQIVRLMHFVKGLQDGQMPVRWAGTALAGYGYPLFIFTYRVPFYLAILAYGLTHSLTISIKISFLFSFIFSGWAMYLLGRSLFGNRWAAFTAAFFYLWAPYRFSIIFVRAAMGEAWIFVFLPLIFWIIWNLGKKVTRPLVLLTVGSLSTYGLLASHAMLFYMVLPFIILWAVFVYFQAFNRKKYSIYLFFLGILSVLISAFYIIPAFFEKQSTQFETRLGTYYADHFISLKQLIYSPWGFGFSLPGPVDGMSFQIGIAQWVIVGLVCGLFLMNKIFKKKNHIFAYFLIVFFISIMLMLPISSGLYKLFLTRFMVIDLPWRYLTMTTFCSALMAGGLIKQGKKTTLILVPVMLLAIYANRNHWRVNQYIYNADSEYWQNKESSNERDEYRPKTFTLESYDQTDPFFPVKKGKVVNTTTEQRSNKIVFTSLVDQDTDFTVKLAYYPGWQMQINGQLKEVVLDQGLPLISLPAGRYEVQFSYKETSSRLIIDYLSLISLAGLVLFCLKETINGRKR
jgi:hypothetical protein